MEIPRNLPPYKKPVANESDVTREQLSAIESTNAIVPRTLTRANQLNGINRIKSAPPKDPFKNYFEGANVEVLPTDVGDTTALPIFRKLERRGGGASAAQHSVKRRRLR